MNWRYKQPMETWMVMQLFKKSSLRVLLIYSTLGNHDWYVNYKKWDKAFNVL